MENWRPIAGWSIGAIALVLVFATAQAVLNTFGSPTESFHLSSIARIDEHWLDKNYDWSSLPYVCLVGGEATLAAWFLGRGTQLFPRDSHPILPFAGAGLIVSAVLLAAVGWISGMLSL